MIVYKYVPFDSAEKIISQSSIGFSGMRFLNDPFEGGYINADERLRSRLHSKYAVLSFTRQPLNSLMWAHYGDSHQGVVLEIDAEKAGLCNTDTCLIPAQYGDVIYTSNKPIEEISLSYSNDLRNYLTAIKFSHDCYEFYKLAFLHKSLDWAYEEEVRVVKSIGGYPDGEQVFGEYNVGSDVFNRTNIGSKDQERPLDCLSIRPESIVSAYLGLRVNQENKMKAVQWATDLKIKLYKCGLDSKSWNLKAEPYIVKNEYS